MRVRATGGTRCLPASRCGRSPATRSGGDATIARVAREVHELWKLNRERIATGDPDLILIGTVLRLR